MPTCGRSLQGVVLCLRLLVAIAIRLLPALTQTSDVTSTPPKPILD